MREKELLQLIWLLSMNQSFMMTLLMILKSNLRVSILKMSDLSKCQVIHLEQKLVSG